MSTDARLEQALNSYELSVFGGDSSRLTDAERGLDAVEADVALARGRLLHARFLAEREHGSPVEDPAELSLFRRAAELYQGIGDVAGEADARFWIGCVHQVVRSDESTARPELERSRALAEQAGARLTLSYALRHLGFMAHQAGDLDTARAQFEESTRLRREVGFRPGVAANLIGLAYVAAAQGRHDDAATALDEAGAIAATDALAFVRHVEQARTQLKQQAPASQP
ncbi:MAG: tetratricopeptide repeat protein [Actinocatenispora sp.]